MVVGIDEIHIMLGLEAFLVAIILISSMIRCTLWILGYKVLKGILKHLEKDNVVISN